MMDKDKVAQINKKPVCISLAKIPEFLCGKTDKKYWDFKKILEFYHTNIDVDIDNDKLSIVIPECSHDNKIRQVCDEWLINDSGMNRAEFLIFTLDDTGKVVQDAVYAPLCDIRSFTKLSSFENPQMYKLEFKTRFCRSDMIHKLAQEYVDQFNDLARFMACAFPQTPIQC